jgi:RNA polymerase sigma-70 factor (ECF subfamily)
VQEALARAWSRRHAVRTPEARVAWALQITRNESRRVLERRIRRSGRELVGTELLEVREEDDRLAGTAVRVTVRQALGHLEDAERDVIRLRYGEDLTQAEVARRLNLPEGTVKVRLHRARRRLRAMLEETI